jgi:hypothetical protein
MTTAALLMGVCVYFLWQGLISSLGPLNFWLKLLLLLGVCGLGILVYALLSWIMGISELNRYLNYLKGALSRLKGAFKGFFPGGKEG